MKTAKTSIMLNVELDTNMEYDGEKGLTTIQSSTSLQRTNWLKNSAFGKTNETIWQNAEETDIGSYTLVTGPDDLAEFNTYDEMKDEFIDRMTTIFRRQLEEALDLSKDENLE